MPTTKTDPLVQRERLQGELRSATQAAQAVGRRLAELKTQRQELDAERLHAYAALACGEQEAAKRVDKAEKRRTTLLADIERATVEMEGAKHARQNVGAELARLLQDELATFADEADEYTQEAVEAFAAIEEPYRRALEAWRAAEVAWQPLLPAVRAVVQHKEQEDGVWRAPANLARAATVAAFPLPDAAQLLAQVASGQLAPRPIGLTPTEDEA